MRSLGGACVSNGEQALWTRGAVVQSIAGICRSVPCALPKRRWRIATRSGDPGATMIAGAGSAPGRHGQGLDRWCSVVRPHRPGGWGCSHAFQQTCGHATALNCPWTACRAVRAVEKLLTRWRSHVRTPFVGRSLHTSVRSKADIRFVVPFPTGAVPWAKISTVPSMRIGRDAVEISSATDRIAFSLGAASGSPRDGSSRADRREIAGLALLGCYLVRSLEFSHAASARSAPPLRAP